MSWRSGRINRLSRRLRRIWSTLRRRPSRPGETVVLVHGLGGAPAQMSLLGRRLRAAGYRVVNPKFSSAQPLESIVEQLANVVRTCQAKGAETVHFVTHSLGGLVVRAYLAGRSEPYDGRVVMLSPPNQGSEIVDAFQRSPLLTSILGPVGAQLGTNPESIPSSLGPANFDVGIIAGDKSINPIGSWLIPGPSDGTVSVERTRLEGAAAFKVVSGTHTFLMNRIDVARDVIRFLHEGRFSAS